jgi:hypothetical protein
LAARAGVPAGIGEDRDGPAEALAAGPAEFDGAVLAGLPGDRGYPGEGGIHPYALAAARAGEAAARQGRVWDMHELLFHR